MKKGLIAVLLLLLFVSCGKKEGGSGSGGIGEKLGKPSRNEANETDKYNSYVQIHNRLSAIDEQIDYYLSEAGNSETVKKHENPGIGFRGISKNLIDSIKEVTAKKPEMKELDASAEKLGAVLSEFLPVAQESDKYYDGKEFLSDSYAKAQEIHTKLLEQIKKYDPVVTEFRSAMEVKAKEVQKRNMENFKKAGQLIRYNRIVLLGEAEEFIKEMESQKLNGANFTGGDAAKLKPALEKLSAAIDEHEKVSKDPEQVKKEGLRDSAVDGFSRAALKFKASAATLINRIETKKGASDFHIKNPSFLDNDEGTPENIYKEFNKLVEEYNRSNR